MADEALKHDSSTRSEWYWKFLGIKAHILELEGQVNESLALLDRDFPAQYNDTDFSIRRDLTRALDHAYEKQSREATELIARAEVSARTSHHELLGEVALRKGTVCFLEEDIGCAQRAYRDAMQAAREHKDPYFEAAALSGLGICYTRMEHYDEAIDAYRAASDVARDSGAAYSQAQVLGNTAWCYRKLGDYENALALYGQAQEASRNAGIVSDEFYWLNGAAYVYYYQGNFAAAESVLLQSLNLARSLDDKSILIGYLNELAGLSLDTGKTEDAEKYLREASMIDPSKMDAESAMDLAIIRASIEQNKGNDAVAEKSWKAIAADSRSDSSQKWEAQVQLARIYARQGKGAAAEREYRRLLATVDQARSSVKNEELRLSFLASVIAFYDDYIEFLVTRKRVEDALSVAELSRARTLAEGLDNGKGGLAAATSRIHPRELALQLKSTLLFYWTGREHSYLWVISPWQIACLPIAGRADLDPALQNYRKAIVSGEDVLATGNMDGTKLYRMLVAPARDHIPQNARVVVLPSENLYGLNFETLIAPEPSPHYWIEDVTLSTAGSLTLLSGMRRTISTGSRNLLLVGNTESPNKDFPPLPQGDVEVQKVSAHFTPSQRRILQGKLATPSAYLQSNPQEFAYLHFVTHGTASLTRPLESAVILSREGDSYKLYARDIVSHPLDARLVTISACNGAGTRAYAGEGLVGLSWAFLRAGAHNVIASLWEVSDATSTGQLMDQLYRGLDQGDDPAVALRNAKLFVLKTNSSNVFRKPFYWAPFQLYTGS